MTSKKLMAKDSLELRRKANYYRTYEASPIYSFKNDTTISAGASFVNDFAEDNSETQKHLPFSTMQVVNNSSSPIYLYINQSNDGKIIPAGTILTFDRNTIPAVTSIKYTNAHASNTIAVNEIEIAVWREGVVIDSAFKKLHQALFKVLYG